MSRHWQYLKLVLGAVMFACACQPLPEDEPLDWMVSARAKTYNTFDRVAHPFASWLLNDQVGWRNQINQIDPSQDRAELRLPALEHIDQLRQNLSALDGFGEFLDETTSEQAVDAMLPNVIVLDLDQPSGYPNGRRLDDQPLLWALRQIYDYNFDLLPNSFSDFETDFPFLKRVDDAQN